MIRKIDINEIPGRRVSYNNMLQQEIRDFLASDWSAAEIDISKYKSAYTAVRAYGIAAKRMNADVTATARGGRAFIIKNTSEA